LDDIFADCADYMHEKMKQNEAKYAQIKNPEATADILGISGVMVQDMSGKRFVAVSTPYSGCSPLTIYQDKRLRL